ncbi:OmpA family protein [Paraburkholderia bryophila]|uniref:OmpA family protein n=1 Tax=Paraburkholderia bryophila TaxID=420952 RepID=A0A329BJ71_9BURK|nr:OmpA family protein [Paraburkholderia bryophila]RAS21927.1 OmpA family protein [Paraburkholderia bryophila]
MKLQLTMLVCALSLTACADRAARERLGIEDTSVLRTGIGATQDEPAGAANSQWLNAYAPIANSRGAAIASLQDRLNRVPVSSNRYFHAKAQCWLDAAQQARDQWGFVEEAIGQAAMITMGIERDTPLSAANPALRTVSTVRPDLWAIVNAIKTDPALAQCPQAQPPLACAEVELMQAGHDAWIRSFANAEKRLPDVKDNLRKSAETALQCQQGMSAAVPASVPALALPASAPHTFTLRMDSLFRFNGTSLLPAGRRQLDSVVSALESAPAAHALEVTGYADRLGGAAHNQWLSMQRAQTVEQYLRAHGVTLPIAARGRGSANQRVECHQTRQDALVQCLAPNRRVEIELVGAAS